MEHLLTSCLSIALHWQSKVGHENIDIPQDISSEIANSNSNSSTTYICAYAKCKHITK